VERDRIPDFIEEVLRLEGTVKAIFRLAKTSVSVGGIDLAPGTTVMLVMAAANRDPRRFERPHEILLERTNLRDHLSFGRGVHACIGSPLARAEAKIVIERLFDVTSEFRIDEAMHGPAGARRFEYQPTFMFRILKELHLEFDPLR
jgi:cytochrome P450